MPVEIRHIEQSWGRALENLKRRLEIHAADLPELDIFESGIKATMGESAKFLYVTYIAATAERVWQALTDPDVTRRWYRVTSAATPMENLSDWKPGSRWQRRRLDDAQTVDIVGTVLANAPPRRLAVTWARPTSTDDAALNSRLTFDIEPHGDGLV